MASQNLIRFSLLLLLAQAIGVSVFAVPNVRPPNCVLPTQYNVAVERAGVHFLADVRLQGTGINRSGKIVHVKNGRLVADSKPQADPDGRLCKVDVGEVIGASGFCLYPFFTIAADPAAGYRMGDIIYIPQVRGKVIRNPLTGQTGVHNGYFMVSDTGGAIDGKGRFDFFIGKLGPNEPANPFSASGSMPMPSRTSCSWTHRLIRRGSSEWPAARRALGSLYDSVYGYPSRANPPRASNRSAR